MEVASELGKYLYIFSLCFVEKESLYLVKIQKTIICQAFLRLPRVIKWECVGKKWLVYCQHDLSACNFPMEFIMRFRDVHLLCKRIWTREGVKNILVRLKKNFWDTDMGWLEYFWVWRKIKNFLWSVLHQWIGISYVWLVG